jgi:hypothetical protein
MGSHTIGVQHIVLLLQVTGRVLRVGDANPGSEDAA